MVLKSKDVYGDERKVDQLIPIHYAGALNDIGLAINALAHLKGWYDPAKTDFEALLLMASEIFEAVEELRNGHDVKEVYYLLGEGIVQEVRYMDMQRALELGKAGTKPEGVPIELADAIIRILDFAAEHGIDIEGAMRAKHAYNATRPHRHGGKLI